MGLNVPRAQMADILLALDFTVEEDAVIPPSYRADVAHKADLAEEIARFYGYNIIPSKELSGGVYGTVSPRQKRESLAVSALLAQGF